MLPLKLRFLAGPLVVVLPLVAAVALWGCSSSSQPASEVASAAGADHAHGSGDADHDHGDHDHGDASDDPLSSFSAEDRALIEKQKICPVSGEELTEMSAPIKIDVNGRTVFLCCEDCKAPIMKNPEKYLSKLDEQK